MHTKISDSEGKRRQSHLAQRSVNMQSHRLTSAIVIPEVRWHTHLESRQECLTSDWIPVGRWNDITSLDHLRCVAGEYQADRWIRLVDDARRDELALIPRRPDELSPASSEFRGQAEKQVCTAAGAFLVLGFDLQ